jgi:hypothetical protein
MLLLWQLNQIEEMRHMHALGGQKLVRFCQKTSKQEIIS